MPEFTASKPYGHRRFSGGTKPKTETKYTRDIYADGKHIATWQSWSRCWKLDWSYLQRGIYIAEVLCGPGVFDDMFAVDQPPPGMRQRTEAEWKEYIALWRQRETSPYVG